MNCVKKAGGACICETCLCLQAKQWLYRGNVIMIFYYEEGHLKFAGISAEEETPQQYLK